MSSARSRAPGWWVVFTRELADHWIGGKALGLVLFFCVMVAGAAMLQAVISVDDPIPPREMIFSALGLAISFGLVMGLVIGADSLSGERERGTLEALLLTPMSRRHIVAGKFLAAVSVWPVAMVVTAPYLTVLAQGDDALGPALRWGVVLGSLLAAAFAGLGMLVSFWSNANKTSLTVSLTLYLLCFLPTQMPSGAQKGFMGYLLKRVNPIEAVNQFLENVIVNNRTPHQMMPWLRGPAVFAVLVLGLLLWHAEGLSLDNGLPWLGRFGRRQPA